MYLLCNSYNCRQKVKAAIC